MSAWLYTTTIAAQHDNVAFGSNSEVRARNWEVRLTLKNRHRRWCLLGPKSANTGRGRRKASQLLSANTGLTQLNSTSGVRLDEGGNIAFELWQRGLDCIRILINRLSANDNRFRSDNSVCLQNY